MKIKTLKIINAFSSVTCSFSLASLRWEKLENTVGGPFRTQPNTFNTIKKKKRLEYKHFIKSSVKFFARQCDFKQFKDNIKGSLLLRIYYYYV